MLRNKQTGELSLLWGTVTQQQGCLDSGAPVARAVGMYFLGFCSVLVKATGDLEAPISTDTSGGQNLGEDMG